MRPKGSIYPHPILIFILVLIGCKKDPVEVEFWKIQNNVALFTVENNTEKDIYSVAFEVTLFSKDKSVLKIDTVSYSNTRDAEGKMIPFVEAGQETFFSYGIPEETASTSARTIEFDFEN